MPITGTRPIAAVDGREAREARLVELVLLASEATEDAFELDDLVDDWMRAESGGDEACGFAARPPEGPGPIRVQLARPEPARSTRPAAA